MSIDLSDPAMVAHQSWFDGERRLRLARRAVWLGAAIFAVFIPIDLFLTGYLIHAAVEALALAALLVVGWLLRRRDRLESAQWIGTLSVALVIVVVVATGIAADGVVVWLALFPPIPFFLFGIRRGLIVSALFTIVVLGLLTGGVVSGAGGGHSAVAVLSAAGALVASTSFAYLYEHTRGEAARMLVVAANTDLLTGVPNRRGFLAGFDCRRALAVRAGQVISLLVFDVDHLKQINDGHGHAAGDAAIRHVAALVRAQVREQDLLGRLGGDEFALLLPNTHLDGALTLAAKLRESLRLRPLRHAGTTIRITLSIGAAQAPPGPIDFDVLFATADRQLYAAKRNGRDLHIGALA
jgi:diguanylate cyclase (GGDEF)-like protein